ncbi:transposase family protein [Actinomyces sp. 594]|uniref:helix-turn-helix domain-containing protein n=1 Tax=Actinomyces sp. 594 TaxID=2057793 RepID=UPI00214CEA75|nr:transposase family protein [Actinomyces sp. 594]MBW3068504.1 transposase family protein [Actinomyces sp. 594]
MPALHKHGELPKVGSRALGLYQRVKLTVMALRHNLTQQVLAESFDVSQPTVSRIISSYKLSLPMPWQTTCPRWRTSTPPRC